MHSIVGQILARASYLYSLNTEQREWNIKITFFHPKRQIQLMQWKYIVYVVIFWPDDPTTFCCWLVVVMVRCQSPKYENGF